jgi:hypothetical protein
MVFVADLNACRLMSVVVCKPVTPRLRSAWVPCVADVNGAYYSYTDNMEGFIVWCHNKRGIISLCFPCAFSVCWVEEVSTPYLISISCFCYFLFLQCGGIL